MCEQTQRKQTEKYFPNSLGHRINNKIVIILNPSISYFLKT